MNRPAVAHGAAAHRQPSSRQHCHDYEQGAEPLAAYRRAALAGNAKCMGFRREAMADGLSVAMRCILGVHHAPCPERVCP
jgi:hypothetical protein